MLPFHPTPTPNAGRGGISVRPQSLFIPPSGALSSSSQHHSYRHRPFTSPPPIGTRPFVSGSKPVKMGAGPRHSGGSMYGMMSSSSMKRYRSPISNMTPLRHGSTPMRLGFDPLLSKKARKVKPGQLEPTKSIFGK